MTQSQVKITKVSSLFHWIFLAIIFALPIVHLLSWIYAPVPFDVSGKLGFFTTVVPQGTEILHPLSVSTKIMGFLVGSIPVILIEFILYFLIKLFKLYKKGEIFSLKNVNYIKSIGKILLLTQFANFICNGILSGLLSWHNPHGFRAIRLTISTLHIGMIFMSFLIILISWIMAEGCHLRDEQQLTI